MTEDRHDVVVIGVDRAEQRLTKAGITDVVVVDGGHDLDGAVFDEATHTWTLPTCRARIVISDQTRCGRDNLVPYLGVAVHGVPNYFTVTGAQPVADARLDYIAECLKLMRRTASTRIEVRYSTQRMFHDRSRDKPDRADATFWRRMRKLALVGIRPQLAHRHRRRPRTTAPPPSASATTSTRCGCGCRVVSIPLTADITGRERFSTHCPTRCSSSRSR